MRSQRIVLLISYQFSTSYRFASELPPSEFRLDLRRRRRRSRSLLSAVAHTRGTFGDPSSDLSWLCTELPEPASCFLVPGNQFEDLSVVEYRSLLVAFPIEGKATMQVGRLQHLGLQHLFEL